MCLTLQVEISYHISWRRSWSSATFCDDTTVSTRTAITGLGSFSCQYGCSGAIASLPYICTDYSTEEDWSYGEYHLVFNFASTTPDNTVTIGFTSCCWVSFGNWNLSTTFSVARRSDTGLINSSPRAITSPVLRLQQGCNHTIVLAVSDPDNDIVRCRWAVGGECAGICHTSTFAGATLDSDSCSIKYEANRGTGYQAAAIMIEDFMPGSSRPLSSVSLQFLILIIPATEACSAQPQFIDPTLPNGVCISITPGATFTTQLTANSFSSILSIVEFQTVSPIGTNRGQIQHTPGSNVYYVNIAWTPSASQQNQTHLFCYTALNSVGVSSEQRCVLLAAGYYPPVPYQEHSLSTKQLFHSSNIAIVIRFDRAVKRPSLSSHLFFFEFYSDKEVHRIDTSSSSEITFNNITVTVVPNHLFTERQTYYLTFERGVVQGIEGCGASNDPVMNKNFWVFAITGTVCH